MFWCMDNFYYRYGGPGCVVWLDGGGLHVLRNEPSFVLFCSGYGGSLGPLEIVLAGLISGEAGRVGLSCCGC